MQSLPGCRRACVSYRTLSPLHESDCHSAANILVSQATFTVNVEVPVGMTALSNMPANNTSGTDRPDLSLVAFGQTPVMSTYLLALCVGHMTSLAGTTGAAFHIVDALP